MRSLVLVTVLMDVPDVTAAVREASRVLTRDGVLTVSIVHPFIDRGEFSGPDPDASFVVDEAYFGSRHFTGREDRDGPPCTSRGGRGRSRTTRGPCTRVGSRSSTCGSHVPTPRLGAGPLSTSGTGCHCFSGSTPYRSRDLPDRRTALPDPGSARGLLRVGAARSPVTACAGPVVTGEGPQGPAPSPRALACVCQVGASRTGRRRRWPRRAGHAPGHGRLAHGGRGAAGRASTSFVP